jgi:hypothetical protein
LQRSGWLELVGAPAKASKLGREQPDEAAVEADEREDHGDGEMDEHSVHSFEAGFHLRSLGSQLGFDAPEALVCIFEAPSQLFEALVDDGEMLVHRIEAAVDFREALVHRVEALID